MKRPTLAPVVARIGPAPLRKQSFPMLPWYPASFLSSTRGWSVTARGVYRELLDCQWELGALPADSADLQTLIGAIAGEWKYWPKLVESKFPVGADGLRRNETLERHRVRAIERSDKARQSAEEKWRQARAKLGRDQGGGGDANA